MSVELEDGKIERTLAQSSKYYDNYRYRTLNVYRRSSDTERD